jgi:hypothetical protein
MPFPATVREEALVRSKRACCVCNTFAGRAAQVHHIIQEADGGNNDIDNAIVLCLRCHSEVGHYNPRHPIGNDYSPREIRRLRNAWWKWCEENPNQAPPQHPVHVSPMALAIVEGGRRLRAGFSVLNSTDRILYAVWVQLVFDLVDIHKDHIRVHSSIDPVQSDPLLHERDSLPIGASGYVKDGKPARWVIIKEIKPHEQRVFVGEVDQSVILPKGASAIARLDVVNFDEEPTIAVSEADGQIEVKWVSHGYAVESIEINFKGSVPPALDALPLP